MADKTHDELDRMLDAALAKYAAAEPRAGLEARVLANLRARDAGDQRSGGAVASLRGAADSARKAGGTDKQEVEETMADQNTRRTRPHAGCSAGEVRPRLSQGRGLEARVLANLRAEREEC